MLDPILKALEHLADSTASPPTAPSGTPTPDRSTVLFGDVPVTL